MSKMASSKAIHKPVMLKEVIQLLKEHLNTIDLSSTDNVDILDLTLGDGGHSKAIYDFVQEYTDKNKLNTNFNLYSFDWDKSSMEFVIRQGWDISGIFYCDIGCSNVEFKKGEKTKNKNTSHVKWHLVNANFAWIQNFSSHQKLDNIIFVLADLGVSSRQLEIKNRGFSFQSKKGVADMRMARDFMQVKAYDLLNGLSEKELRDLFVTNIGMPKHIATSIAKEIVKQRQLKPFGFEDDLYRLNKIAFILKNKGIRKLSSSKIHPATLIYLALRIAVNAERQNLFQMLQGLGQLSKKTTKLAILGFHSGEWELLETLPSLFGFKLTSIQVPTQTEIRDNSRARSAKLFVYKYE